jgi:hypothetical protein
LVKNHRNKIPIPTTEAIVKSTVVHNLIELDFTIKTRLNRRIKLKIANGDTIEKLVLFVLV